MMVCQAPYAVSEVSDPAANRCDVPRESQDSPLWRNSRRLAPLAMPGTLVGCVVDPCGPLTQVRLLVRDAAGRVVRELYPCAPRPGHVAVWFEVTGLPADTYTLEIKAPGCCRDVRDGVEVEASCITDVGIVRLMRSYVPEIAAQLRCEAICPPFMLSGSTEPSWLREAAS